MKTDEKSRINSQVKRLGPRWAVERLETALIAHSSRRFESSASLLGRTVVQLYTKDTITRYSHAVVDSTGAAACILSFLSEHKNGYHPGEASYQNGRREDRKAFNKTA